MQSRQSYFLYGQGKELIKEEKKVVYRNSLCIRPPLQRNQQVKNEIQFKRIEPNIENAR
jgi:hypothetical protein